ncbi:hypothetical protein GGR58DRAFT_201439 [Xylaria digitata]|nr:hypothetical protein GGR58DRAFT_201439 [Xylaria digitata]
MALNGNGERRLAAILVGISVSTIAVATRFWCRHALKTGIHADDWWILVTLVSYVGGQGALLWGLFEGTGGREIKEIEIELQSHPSPEVVLSLENYLESLVIGVTIVYFVLWTAKMSICLFYRRIFTTPKYRALSLIVMGLATAWFIGTEVANLVICIPFDIFWHRMKPGRCLNFNLFYLINGIAETIIDAIILALPVRAVFTVQVPLKTKILVSGIFLLGGLYVKDVILDPLPIRPCQLTLPASVIVTNILRIYYSYQPNTQFITFTNSEIWTNVHITTAILCACLPVYKPLRAKATELIRKLRSTYSSSRQHVLGSGSLKIPDDHSGEAGDSFHMGAVRPGQTSSGRSIGRSNDSVSDLLPVHDGTMPASNTRFVEG